MADWRPVPLPPGSYADDTRSFAHQDVLGFIPTRAEQEGARSGLMLNQLPGMREFAAYPNASRHRGARNVEGRLLFVVDTSLCQLQPNGSISVLGTIPGTGRVSISHNQILNGNEVLITTGTLGFIYNTVTADLDQITDPGFKGGLQAKFIGARFITLDPGRRFFQNSALAEGLEWNATEYATGESDPDRIRAIEVINNELVLLNESTLEHFEYRGETNELFANKGISIGRGCAATHAVSVMDNALYFIGNDGSGYEKRGYEIQRITTHAIEQAWSREDLSKAFSMVWEDKGHKVWYVTFPNGLTWGFDAATRHWHRRSSYGPYKRWRAAWLAPWGNGSDRAWYAGDFNSGRIFQLDWKYPFEGRDIYWRGFSPGLLHRDSNRVFLHAVRLEVEAGPTVEASAVQSLVLSGSLPDCAVGDTVSYQYTVTGGFSPYAWEVETGALPAGLTLDPDTGLVSGTTTTAEHDNLWTIKVTDANGDTVTLDDGAYVLDMLGDPPDALNGDDYSYALTGTEGEPDYTFVKISGSLPTGATLSSAGLIAGHLTEDGVFTFTVTMTDSEGVTQTKTYNIGVSVSYGTIFTGSASAASPNIPLTIIDGDTNTVTATVMNTTQILWVTVNADGSRVYYLDPVNQTVGYLQTSDNTFHVLATSIPNNGVGLLIDATETYLWVLDFDNQFLRKVRVSDGALIASIATATNLTRMCWKDEDREVIYLSSYYENYIRQYNTATATWGANIASATDVNRHYGLGVASDTGYVYAVGRTDYDCYVVQLRPGLSAGTSVTIPTEGRWLAVLPDGSKTYAVNDAVAGKVYVIDNETPALVATITVGQGPSGVAVSAMGRVYVPCQTSNELYVIDSASDTIVDTITVGSQSYGCTFLES